jgi:hypothetical protein
MVFLVAYIASLRCERLERNPQCVADHYECHQPHALQTCSIAHIQRFLIVHDICDRLTLFVRAHNVACVRHVALMEIALSPRVEGVIS